MHIDLNVKMEGNAIPNTGNNKHRDYEKGTILEHSRSIGQRKGGRDQQPTLYGVRQESDP